MRIDNNLELRYIEQYPYKENNSYYYKENNSYYCLIYNKDNIFKSVNFYVDGLDGLIIGYDDFKIIFKDYQNNIIIKYIKQQVKNFNKDRNMEFYENIIKLFSDLINNKKRKEVEKNGKN